MPDKRRVAHVDGADPVLSCCDGSAWYLAPADWLRASTWRALDELAFYDTDTEPFNRRILHTSTGFVARATERAGAAGVPTHHRRSPHDVLLTLSPPRSPLPRRRAEWRSP